MQIRARQSYPDFVAASEQHSTLAGEGESYWNFLETNIERQIRLKSKFENERSTVRSKFELL